MRPGPIGLLALQVCKANGATTVVIGTNVDTTRLNAARRLGADHVLNIQEVGAAAVQQRVAALTGGWMADVVFECAGAAPAADTALQLVRRGGRYGQIGLFGTPVTWNADLLCYKEIRLFGSFATVPSSWPQALALLAAGRIDAGITVSDVLPLTEWETAFARLRAKDALKIMLTPA